MKKIGGYPHNGYPMDMHTSMEQIFFQWTRVWGYYYPYPTRPVDIPKNVYLTIIIKIIIIIITIIIIIVLNNNNNSNIIIEIIIINNNDNNIYS